MVEQVEISSLDLRYQGFRMRCPGAEKALLLSILEKGIRDPLFGIDTQQIRILLAQTAKLVELVKLLLASSTQIKFAMRCEVFFASQAPSWSIAWLLALRKW